MGQVASYVAQNENQYQFPYYNVKDSRVCQKSKPMLEFIFGWSDASKCKNAIKQTYFHMKELKNRRFCIVKQLRDDTEKLMKAGESETAFVRVDQLYKDECMVVVYDLLAHIKELKTRRFCIVKHLRDDTEKLMKAGESETAFMIVDQLYKDECMVVVYDLLAQFCERILFHLSHIRGNKSCPKDVIEAISSLIFASARCGDLRELLYIRKLFRGRYGKRLETEAVDLLPGNHVNIQIIEKLSIHNVSDKVKYMLLEEINKSNMNQAESWVSGQKKKMWTT